MTYAEIQSLHSEKIESHKKLAFQLSKLNREISDLRNQLQKIESDLLLDFIGLENKIVFTGHCRFNGKQINLKNTRKLLIPNYLGKETEVNTWPSIFQVGDEIEIIKKNKVSVVIRCTKKTYNKKVYDMNAEWRVSFEELKDYILRNSETANRFRNWIKRTQSLDSLLS